MKVLLSPVLIPPNKLPINNRGTTFTQCTAVPNKAILSINMNALRLDNLDTSYDDINAPIIAPNWIIPVT